MKVSRFALRIGFAAALAGFAASSQAQAQAQSPSNYPNRPIRFITPYAPGGSTSFMARLVGQQYTERWGQNVIIDNRPGGNTIIGTETLAKSPPDGYTIMLVTSTHSILSSLTKTPYDPIKDFSPIANIGYAPQVLVLFPGVPANTVAEVITFAKANPNKLNFASSGAGGPTHLSGELFNLIAGVKTQHIPYKGAGPAMNDLLGGHVQMFFSVPVNILGHVKNGKLKSVAVTGPNRLVSLPNMPTFAEAGMPTFDVKTWNGVIGPAGISRAIVDRLSAEVGAMLQKPDIKEKLDTIGVTPLYYNPEQFLAMIKHDQGMYLKVIKANNIRIE